MKLYSKCWQVKGAEEQSTKAMGLAYGNLQNLKSHVCYHMTHKRNAVFLNQVAREELPRRIDFKKK